MKKELILELEQILLENEKNLNDFEIDNLIENNQNINILLNNIFKSK